MKRPAFINLTPLSTRHIEFIEFRVTRTDFPLLCGLTYEDHISNLQTQQSSTTRHNLPGLNKRPHRLIVPFRVGFTDLEAARTFRIR